MGELNNNNNKKVKILRYSLFYYHLEFRQCGFILIKCKSDTWILSILSGDSNKKETINELNEYKQLNKHTYI